MTKRFIRSLAIGVIAIGILSSKAEFTLDELFEERRDSVLAVEFFVETEVDRRPVTVNGMVVSNDGVLQLAANAIPGWVSIDKLKEFKVYVLGESKAYDAEYLGSDRAYGWHFVQVEEVLRDRLKPVTDYQLAEMKTGQSLWGIGVAMKNLDFKPYFMRAEVSTIQLLPATVGFATREITSPGSILFDDSGAFAGWGTAPLNMERYLTIEGQLYQAYLRKPDQTTTFFVASELVKTFGGLPSSPDSNDMTWLGVVGLQTIDDEVAELMGLGDQAAISISQILNDSPAAEAGLRERDLIISIDGEPLKRYTPRRVAVADLEQQIAKRGIGETMKLGISRDGETLEVEIVLGQAPKPVRQASRFYFENLGFTIREFLVYDSVSMKLDVEPGETPGVITSFVKTNSNAHTGGAQMGDLIKEIDGVPIDHFDQAIALIEELEADDSKNEFVLLVARGADTSVLRIALK
ncbi:MAG: PDZ domain-containing protein [Opitutaceae bacterium]|nr:PDZ domain-containing protein [Opitutaceae bacterium]